MAEISTRKRTTGGGAETPPSRRRFSVDEYHRMAEAGILRPDERVELLEGEIYEMAAMGNRHAGRIRFLTRWFDGRLRGRAVVSVQCPVYLASGTEPEPDLALLRPRPEDPDYSLAHPLPADVLLIIEIADTSLAFDRNRKLPVYAEAGIAEVWIVDLTSNHVLVYRDPAATGYRTTITAKRGESLAPLAFPDLQLPVSELLP